MKEPRKERREAVDIIKDAAAKAANVLKDAAAKAAQEVNDAEEKAAQEVSESAAKAAEAVNDAAIKAAEVVKNAAKKATEAVEKVAAAAAASMTDVTNTAAEAIAIVKAETEAVKKELEFQHEKYERELKQLAFYDVLTGLPNRRQLLEHMSQIVKLNHRERKSFAVFMIDLDKFKAANDTFGHARGDDLLKQVSERVTLGLRESDIAARLGGDEFVIVLVNCQTIEDAEKVATKTIIDLTAPFTLSDGNIIQIGASIGISFYPQHGTTPESLIDAADSALYQAKEYGRGCFKTFNKEEKLLTFDKLAEK